MHIKMKSLVPVGTTHRIYRDANKHVFIDDAADWSYFLEFAGARDRIAWYRLYDRQGRLLAEDLTLLEVKKRIQALTAQAAA